MQKPQAFLPGGCRPFQNTNQPTHPPHLGRLQRGRHRHVSTHPSPSPSALYNSAFGHLRLLFRPNDTDISSRGWEGPPPRNLAAGSEVRRLRLGVGCEETKPPRPESPAKETLRLGLDATASDEVDPALFALAARHVQRVVAAREAVVSAMVVVPVLGAGHSVAQREVYA